MKRIIANTYKLSGLGRSKSRIEDSGRDLSKREGFGDWLRDIRRERGKR